MAKTFYKRCEALYKQLERSGKVKPIGQTKDFASSRDITAAFVRGDRGAQLHKVPGIAFGPTRYDVHFSLTGSDCLSVTAKGLQDTYRRWNLDEKTARSAAEKKLDDLLKANGV